MMEEKRKYKKSPNIGRITYPEVIYEKEGNLTLPEAITNNLNRLRDIFEKYRNSKSLNYLQDCFNILNTSIDISNTNFDDVTHKITAQISQDEITNLTRSDWNGICHLKKEGINTINFLNSLLLSILAKQALEGGKTEAGWAFVANAYDYTGQLASIQACESAIKETMKRQQIASKASMARDRNFEPVKRKAIDLLLANSPEGGWKSKSDAIRGIEEDLYQFIRAENIKLAPSNIYDSDSLFKWIEKWLGLDLAMKDALAHSLKNPIS